METHSKHMNIPDVNNYPSWLSTCDWATEADANKKSEPTKQAQARNTSIPEIQLS